MINLTPNEYRAILRQDLYTFLERSFYELNPDVEFLANWHLELIAAELEACRQGATKRLILNVPPRSLKSQAVSVAFPAWLLGHTPSAQIICASYAQSLADKHSMDCRALLLSDWYQELFPTRLSPQRQALQEFVTTRKGFRLATSVGGVLTGRGADFLIVDDALKPDEALSEVQRTAVNDWYDHTLYSRLNSKQNGCIIVVMQRLHEDDLVGHLLQQHGSWKLLRLPAIADQDETHVIASMSGPRTVRRRVGEALHPAREPLELLEQLRQTQGEYNFAGQYQQAPAPLGGGLVKQSWFKTYTPAELPSEFELIFQSWDCANKNTELADFSVCTTWALKKNQLYLLDVLRKRLDYPQLKRAARAQAETFHPKNILIEDKAAGTQLIQELIYEGVHGITRYVPKMDKILRLHSVTATIENGLVFLPYKAEWLASYLHELTTFPKSKYDDQTDSTSQALDWVKLRYLGPAAALLEFYRQENAKLRSPVCPERN